MPLQIPTDKGPFTINADGTMVFPGQGAVAASTPLLDMVQTWNAAGVTFTGWKLNITDTASDAASKLMDLQVAGVTKFSVGKDGYAKAAWLGVLSGGFLSLNTSTDASLLYADAAGIIAQRNGANAQTFNLYRTWTDASNYQRLQQGWNVSTALIMNQGAGTEADGNIAFNDAALATTATKGYVMIPSCAGPPTGVPADIPTGQVALHFDATNNKLYVYDAAWLSTAALT